MTAETTLQPTDSTWLGEPADHWCPTCDTRLIGDRGEIHDCPICTDPKAALREAETARTNAVRQLSDPRRTT